MADPEFFAHYSIERREDGGLFVLGKGAMGTTYKAFDTKLHCSVALKVINSQILDNEKVRQRFLREARSAAGLRHKNVASVFHLGDEGDTYFYAMEYIDGETIEFLVRQSGRLDPAVAWNITLQVVSALMAAHKRNLIHRDIKPANLMLVREDEDDLLVKVIDFGLAKSLEVDGTDQGLITMDGTFVGTPQFASPEQLEGKTLDARSDIYSLGCTLWYMLTGSPPFTGSVPQVMSQHFSKPPSLDQLADFPQALCAVLQRMLAKDPADRPQTPQLLRQELLTCRHLFSPYAVSSSSADTSGATTILPSIEGGYVQGRDTDVGNPLPSTDNGLPLTGTMIAGRYRLDKYCGGSPTEPFFQARDLQHNQEVALKVLSSGVIAGRQWTSLEEMVKSIQAAPHPNLRQLISLERFPNFGVLVSEWITGFPVIKMLKVRGGVIGLPEVLLLLQQLVQVVDHALEHHLDSLDLNIQHIFIQLPDGEDEQRIDAYLSRPIDRWISFTVKVSALLLESVVDNETMGAASERTIMADMRSVAKAASSNEPDRDYIFALGYIIYELLGGRAFGGSGDAAIKHGPDKLSALSERQNELLCSILVSGNSNRFDVAHTFFDAFRETAPSPLNLSAVPVLKRSNPAAAIAETKPSDAEALLTREERSSPMAPIVTPTDELEKLEADDGFDAPFQEPTKVHLDNRWPHWRIVAGCVGLILIFSCVAVQILKTKHTDDKSKPTSVNAPDAQVRERQLMMMMGMGQEYEKGGDYQKAIGTYVQAAKQFPSYDTPTMRLNEVLFKAQNRIVSDENFFKQLRTSVTEAANSGSTMAMMLLGKHLIITEPTESLKWFKIAAENNWRDAMTQLGKMYWSGTGLESGPDFSQAAFWLGKASQLDDAEAKYLLAQLYMDGRGVNRDLLQSVELLRAAVDMGNTDAMNLLGEFYRDGTGVPISNKQAADYFEQGRKAGNADACSNLGVLYINGKGVDINQHYGMDLLRQGAEHNSALGMYYYALCFEKGIDQKGKVSNPEQAKIWYAKSARMRYPKAIEWCDKNNIVY